MTEQKELQMSLEIVVLKKQLVDLQGRLLQYDWNTLSTQEEELKQRVKDSYVEAETVSV